MVAYCSSDHETVRISPAQGGCGEEHSRNGARVWALDCEACSAVVLGSNRPKVWGWSQEYGYQPGQADVWPGWSGTIADIPLTRDEQRQRDRTRKHGQTELERLQALAMANQLGIPVPQALAEALGGVRALEEMKADPQTLCPDGHANPAGARFCNMCAVSMQVPAEPTSDEADGSAS